MITPYRFRTKRQFWSYSGLGIVTWISSEWDKDTGSWARDKAPLPRGLNRNHNPLLKSIFKGAANTVINQMPTHPLHQHYQQLIASGTKANLARLTSARRIAAVVLAMWKHQEDYEAQLGDWCPSFSTHDGIQSTRYGEATTCQPSHRRPADWRPRNRPQRRGIANPVRVARTHLRPPNARAISETVKLTLDTSPTRRTWFRGLVVRGGRIRG